MTAGTHQHGATVTADGRLLVVGTGAVEPGTGKGPSPRPRRWCTG